MALYVTASLAVLGWLVWEILSSFLLAIGAPTREIIPGYEKYGTD
jgi:hypothetical protein